VKFKLDKNLPASSAAILTSDRHPLALQGAWTVFPAHRAGRFSEVLSHPVSWETWLVDAIGFEALTSSV
jgi:hypothetical protein